MISPVKEFISGLILAVLGLLQFFIPDLSAGLLGVAWYGWLILGLLLWIFGIAKGASKRIVYLEDQLASRQLKIFVGPSLQHHTLDILGTQKMPSARLTVINQENRKIVEFHAADVELLLRTSSTPADVRGRKFDPFPPFNYAWSNRRTHVSLEPGATDDLICAILPAQNARPVFGYANHESPQILEQAAIYEVALQFRGKLEGETEFRFFDFRGEIYYQPNADILEFISPTTDIPEDLKSKVYLDVR